MSSVCQILITAEIPKPKGRPTLRGIKQLASFPFSWLRRPARAKKLQHIQRFVDLGKQVPQQEDYKFSEKIDFIARALQVK